MASFTTTLMPSTESPEYVNIDVKNLTPDLIAELELTDEQIAQIEVSRTKFFRMLVKPKTVRVKASLLPKFGVGDLPTVGVAELAISGAVGAGGGAVGSGGGSGGDAVGGVVGGAIGVAAAVAVGIGVGGLAKSGIGSGIGSSDGVSGGSAAAIDLTARDYTIIVDKSGSMEGERWRQAEEAVKIIAPRVCEIDADGISLYFFSSRFEKFENVKTGEEVTRHFANNAPSGGTALAEVLQDAVEPDNFIVSKSGKHKYRKPETILIVTDGVPDSRDKVERVIVDAANSVDRDEELSITIIQVGNDANAGKWLKQLDDNLQHGTSKAGKAKFDVVDVLSFENLKSMNFAEIIRMSICD